MCEEEPVYDVVVVGAGVIGSYTAYWLAQTGGQNVLLLDQCNMSPNPESSSHGHVRIMQVAYQDKFPYYFDLVPKARMLWRQLEQQSKTTIFRETGFLTICPTSDTAEKTKCLLERADVDYKCLSSSQIRERYPLFNPEDKDVGFLETEAGTLEPDLAVQTLQKQFQMKGGQCKFGNKVEHIIPGDILTIVTAGATYRCKNLIITAGPWTKMLLSQELKMELPIKILKVNVMYWKKKHSEYQDNIPAFVFIPAEAEGHAIYGAPLATIPDSVKVVVNHATESDVDTQGSTADRGWSIDTTSRHIQTRIPGLQDVPSQTYNCYYTMSPDSHYILGKHPGWGNITIGTGFSGHGFNLAPVVGKILHDICLDKKVEYDTSYFKLERLLSSTVNS